MIELELPWPVSENVYRRHVPGQPRPLISKEGRIYKLAVKGVVAMQEIETMKGLVEMQVELFMPDRRRHDTDNVIKILFDALQDAKVYKDDSQVDDYRVRRMRDDAGDLVIVPGGAVVVKLKEVSHG